MAHERVESKFYTGTILRDYATPLKLLTAHLNVVAVKLSITAFPF